MKNNETTRNKKNNEKFFRKENIYIFITDFFGTIFIVLTFSILFFSLLLNPAGIKTMYVVSNSMVPAFKQGDMVLLNENYNALHVQDIIGYRADWANNEIVTHRIVDITQDSIIVKGDNNRNTDPKVSKDKIVGKIVGVVPKAGLMFNPYSIWAFAILGTILTITNELFRYRVKKVKNENTNTSSEGNL